MNTTNERLAELLKDVRKRQSEYDSRNIPASEEGLITMPLDELYNALNRLKEAIEGKSYRVGMTSGSTYTVLSKYNPFWEDWSWVRYLDDENIWRGFDISAAISVELLD
jgi:hypothetical protein